MARPLYLHTPAATKPASGAAMVGAWQARSLILGSAGISSLGAVVPSESACEGEYWLLEVRLAGFLEPAERVSGAHGLY